jgi:hypothetical protein
MDGWNEGDWKGTRKLWDSGWNLLDDQPDKDRVEPVMEK